MSDLTSQNFYKILGLAASADEREIKKAYFSLMRRYPPETHPEQFMKLREAYEVLSNPEARKQYDQVADHDSHTSEQIKLATEAIEGGRYAEAQAILARLLNSRPELDFARDLLGMAYLHAKQPDTALEIFEELTVKAPGNGAYQLHRGHAHHQKKEYQDAEAAYKKAFELSPDDVRALVSLSDCYADQKRWEDALKVLDQAIHLDGTVDFRDFGLFVRKLEVEIERNDSASMAKTLAQLMPIIPDEASSKRYVADRLASLAAPLFAMKRVDDANLLMKEAARLDPKRGTGRMPDTFEVEIDQLPEASKQWLLKQKNTPSDLKIPNSAAGWPIFLLLCGLGGLFFAFVRGFASRYPLSNEGLMGMFIGLLLSGLLTAWALRATIEAFKTPYGAYTIVHPLYMLQVRPTKLIAWPLANLHEPKITHHYTNGVYSTSNIALIFNGKTFGLSIYGQQKAVDFVNGVLDMRRKMLELMYAGLLENGADDLRLIPAELIPEEGAKKETEASKRRSKRGWVGVGVVAATACLVTGITIPMNAVKREANAWNRARSSYGNKVKALKVYLAEYPDARHSEEAKAAIDKVYADAEKKVKAHSSSELAPALLDLVKVLREKQASKVEVKYESLTAFEKLDLEKLPADLKGKVIDPRLAFSKTVNATREREITQALEKGFDKLLGDGVVDIGGNKSGYDDYDYDYDYRSKKKPKVADVPPPVTLIVRYEVGLNGGLYESVKTANAAASDKKFLGIVFYWDLDVKFEGDEKPRYSFEFDSEPAKDIRWTTYGSKYGTAYESPTLPYDKMAESAFTDFSHQIAVRFGVEKATPRAAAKTAAPDPYADDDYYDDEPAPAAPKPAPAKYVKPKKK